MYNTETRFNDIRPLLDSEVEDAIRKLLNDPKFENAVRYMNPDVNWAELEAQLLTYKNRYDFQHEMIYQTVTQLASKVTKGLESDGWKNISKNEAHIFLSNHRDIVLDASFLNILCHENDFDTTEIAIGDNLLIHPWIDTLVRLNKSFVVRRGVSVRQMLEVSKHMSEYIHYTMSHNKESVWMAQREGRAKDGDDKTQESLLKMLSLAGEGGNFIDNLKELNIIPLSISYEYDPCDYLKAREFQLKRDNADYKKTQEDDLINMQIGILGQKGRVFYRFGTSINPQLDEIAMAQTDKRLQIGMVAKVIDNQIYRNYEIYPCNYIALDLLAGSSEFTDKYTLEEKLRFEQYLVNQVNKISDLENKDEDYLTTKILQMYSNPLKNYLSTTE